MERVFLRTYEVFCYALLGVLAFCACYSFADILPSLKDSVSVTIAAWVQGLGTIAAIVGTWMVARHQTKSQISEQKRTLTESNRIHQKIADKLTTETLMRIINAMEMVIYPGPLGNPYISPKKLEGMLQSLRILEGKSLRASLYEKIIEIQTLTLQALDILESHNVNIGLLTVRVQAAIAVQVVAQSWYLPEE